MNLQLSLITKWFDMTNHLIKREDYRNINAYWCNRFILVNGVTKPKDWWEKFLLWYEIDGLIIAMTGEEKWSTKFEFKKFKTNTLTLGYPKKSELDKICKFEHSGIEIRTGNPDLGAEPGKIYFVIKHGNKL